MFDFLEMFQRGERDHFLIKNNFPKLHPLWNWMSSLTDKEECPESQKSLSKFSK